MSYDVSGQIKAPQSMVDVGSTPDITFAESSYNTIPVFQFTSTAQALSNVFERGRLADENLSWISLGVPPDADAITQIRVGISYWTVNTTNVTSHSVLVRLVKDSGALISTTNLLAQTLSTTPDSDWQELTAASPIAILDLYSSAATTFKLELVIALSTTIGTVDYKWVCRHVNTQVFYEYYGTTFNVNCLLTWDW